MVRLMHSGFVLLFLTAYVLRPLDAAYNVISFGARADGRSDSTRSFLRAWASACKSVQPATVYVPPGTFLIKAAVFRGPCKSQVTVRVVGTLVAPSDYRALGNSGYWILFFNVSRVSLLGGTFDAKAAAYWACRKSGKSCPVGARSITFNSASNILVSGLKSMNSQISHLVINSCSNVMVQNVNLVAPDQSPNTDGIHVQSSSGVTITGANIKTGDDCVSIGEGTTNMWMERIACGPGHGISIGSLGKNAKEDGVQNVTVTNTVFTGSDNGVRIKSWAKPSTGFVRNVVFRNIVMNNVANPIIIDQNYCPDNKGCSNQGSGVKISQVTYKNIKGTSATQVAVEFDCSSSNPCRQIRLQDINLTYKNKPATSSCKNIGGASSGTVVPQSCL